MLFSIDEASLSRNGDVVRFWERLVFLVPEQRDEPSGKMVKEKRIHRVMNCAQKSQGHLYTSLIAPDGKTVYAFRSAIEPDAPEILARLKPMLK